MRRLAPLAALLAAGFALAVGVFLAAGNAANRPTAKSAGRLPPRLARLFVPPGEYTFREAVRLRLARAEDFERLPGERRCPPLPSVVPEPSPFPKGVRGGECWRPPEEQGIVFLVLDRLDPAGFGTPEDAALFSAG